MNPRPACTAASKCSVPKVWRSARAATAVRGRGVSGRPERAARDRRGDAAQQPPAGGEAGSGHLLAQAGCDVVTRPLYHTIPCLVLSTVYGTIPDIVSWQSTGRPPYRGSVYFSTKFRTTANTRCLSHRPVPRWSGT